MLQTPHGTVHPTHYFIEPDKDRMEAKYVEALKRMEADDPRRKAFEAALDNLRDLGIGSQTYKNNSDGEYRLVYRAGVAGGRRRLARTASSPPPRTLQ